MQQHSTRTKKEAEPLTIQLKAYMSDFATKILWVPERGFRKLNTANPERSEQALELKCAQQMHLMSVKETFAVLQRVWLPCNYENRVGGFS